MKEILYKCPHCQGEIEVNPAKLLGQRSSPRKRAAARMNAQTRWKKVRQAKDPLEGTSKLTDIGTD